MNTLTLWQGLIITWVFSPYDHHVVKRVTQCESQCGEMAFMKQGVLVGVIMAVDIFGNVILASCGLNPVKSEAARMAYMMECVNLKLLLHMGPV